jgi:phage tail-like protein
MKREGYPLPKFHFEVDWGQELRMGFTEVTGLTFETDVIEYREGREQAFRKGKQPGLKKYSNITLKRGTFLGDIMFYDQWKKTFFFQEGKNKFRGPVTIKLLNEEHKPIFQWSLENAWASKVQSSDFKADTSEIAIETVEIVHEGLKVEVIS